MTLKPGVMLREKEGPSVNPALRIAHTHRGTRVEKGF
jgi:hypothetical protein